MADAFAVLQVHVGKHPWTFVEMGKSCSCYCGVATKSNRYKWATFAVLIVLGSICLISFTTRAAKCATPHYLGVLPQLYG